MFRKSFWKVNPLNQDCLEVRRILTSAEDEVRILDAVFVLAAALQIKFSLSIKFSRTVGVYYSRLTCFVDL